MATTMLMMTVIKARQPLFLLIKKSPFSTFLISKNFGQETWSHREKKLAAFGSAVNTLTSKHIELLPSPRQDSMSKANSTLVVLCGWLAAAEKNLAKYVTFWHRRNVDVLKVSTRWMDLIAPQLTMAIGAPKVATALHAHARALYPNILFHTLSSGGYFYASVVHALVEEEKVKKSKITAELRPHLKGFIFDSLADWPWVLSHRAALHEVVHPALLELLSVDAIKDLLLARFDCPALLRCSPRTVDFFYKRNAVIKENPLRLPALMLISRADPIVDQMGVYRLLRSWHAKGIPVYSQCWTDAPHVQMLRHYPQEYGDLVDAFHCRVTGACETMEAVAPKSPKAPHLVTPEHIGSSSSSSAGGKKLTTSF